jgi:hypothetical protein
VAIRRHFIAPPRKTGAGSGVFHTGWRNCSLAEFGFGGTCCSIRHEKIAPSCTIFSLPELQINHKYHKSASTGMILQTFIGIFNTHSENRQTGQTWNQSLVVHNMKKVPRTFICEAGSWEETIVEIRCQEYRFTSHRTCIN